MSSPPLLLGESRSGGRVPPPANRDVAALRSEAAPPSEAASRLEWSVSGPSLSDAPKTSSVLVPLPAFERFSFVANETAVTATSVPFCRTPVARDLTCAARRTAHAGGAYAGGSAAEEPPRFDASSSMVSRVGAR